MVYCDVRQHLFLFLTVCHRFTTSLRSQCTLVRVCDVTARSLTGACSHELVRDWRLVDVDGCCQQSLMMTLDRHRDHCYRVIMRRESEFTCELGTFLFALVFS